MTDIPTLYDQQAYDEWIEQLAKDEVDIILNELGLEEWEIDYDEVREAVEHSGYLTFNYQDLVNHYSDILKYGHGEIPNRGPIKNPVEADLLQEASEIAHIQVIDDVTNEARRILETEHDIEC